MTTYKSNETLYDWANEVSFSQAKRLDSFAKGEITREQFFEGFRQDLKKIAEAAIKAVEIPEPTAADRKDSPHWADTIDLKREEMASKAERFLLGV